MDLPEFHPRMQRVSGASAEPRHSLQTHSVPKRPEGARATSTPTGRHSGVIVIEALTVVLGLGIFGAIAWFFLAIS